MTASWFRKLWLITFVITWLFTDALFWTAGQWLWGLLWIVILLTVILDEILAVFTDSHHTISTRFGRMLRATPVIGWMIVGLMGVSWVALILHLVWN